MRSVDWLVAITWLALLTVALLVAYVIGNAVVWLAQRVLLLVWPFVQAHGDRIEVSFLVAAVVGLAAYVLRERS